MDPCPLRPCEALLCPRRSTCLNRLPPASGVAQHMPGGGAEVDDSHDTAARRLEVDISRRERVDKNTHSHSHRMDRRSGGGEGSLCGHWSTRRFSRCPTLNPRLRCSAPARPPGTPPSSQMPSPSGSDTTPFFVIANARASGLITLAAAGQAPGAAGWNPAASGELRDQISAQPGTARTAGTGRGRGQGQTTGPFFTTAQHRIPSSTDKEKKHAISGHLGSLCWARSLPRIAIGFPLSGPAITASACCGFGHWRPSPLARMPSLSRPIIMQDTHPRVVLQSRGGSVPLDHGPWKCGQCLVSSPGVCAAFPYYPPRWLIRIPSVYMDSSLLSPVTEALFSLVISFEKLQVRQTDRKRSSSHPPSTTQTGR